jgi:hypothetical protein
LAAFGILFFVADHRLESTLIPLELAFEHRNYLPSLGLILAAANLIGSATGALAHFRPVIAALGLLALFSLGLARSWVWGDAERPTGSRLKIQRIAGCAHWQSAWNRFAGNVIRKKSSVASKMA